MSQVNPSDFRKPEAKSDEIFINRWSPRAMTGETLPSEELMELFEAAKWAPSAYNEQPWQFLYARRETSHWPLFFDLLVDFNKQWVKDAAVLLVILSKKEFSHNKQPNTTHSFDTGAAWENLALQGSVRNLVVHGMAGFDAANARELLHIPEAFQVEAMAAIGRPAGKEVLPKEMQEREVPSGRKTLAEIIHEGPF